MLTSDKVNVNSINAEDIHCALIHAIRYNHLPLVHLLLNHEKVDVNSNHQGHTALTMACYKGRLEVIRALFNDVKVDVNVKTKDGESALSFATWNGFQAEAILLLLKNDKVHVNAKEIQSVLFRAINYKHLEMVRDVLNHEKVNINAKDRDGNTALINAISDGSVEVVRALLTHDGVDVYIKNNDGDTALICALNQKKDDVARLLEGHMKRDRRNKFSWTRAALICAILWGCLMVLCTMLNRQAVNVYISDNNGASSLDCDISAGVLEERVSGEKRREEEEQKRREEEGQKPDKYSDRAHALVEEREKGREEEERNRLKDAERLQTLEEENAYCAEEDQTRREVTELLQALEKDLEGRREDAECVQAVEAKQEKRRKEVEQKRREDAGRAQALEEERRRYEFDGDAHIKKNKMGWTWMILVCASFWGSWNMVSSYFAKIEQFRKRLHHVMNTTSAEPVELSLAYIERCIKKDHKLGSGAFGDVFLAEDSRLPKKFAVKMISAAHSDQDTIKEIRRSFQTELSTLKRFRHPNIIVLYGYSLITNSSQQFLVYEHAANGSLAGFFADDGNRARLSADTRLSIMFQLVRAVHFLHTGGCKVSGKGWKVFHRDIKSANICLADDFTPRLIDCGLAEFVPDESSNAIPGTFTISVRSKAGGPAFGTPGYICPEFARKTFEGISCPYVAAFDVFSIGVVIVEIILGCLNGGQSTRDGIQFENAFRRYVKDERDQLVVDGWEKLKGDVDRTSDWNAVALEVVCKAAIQCMSPFPEDRLSTKDFSTSSET
ncbi:serine/threonine kinase [Fragilaria crotonensis]|nr:serine/threonine kinase [Fragilaria crotonensis]